MIQLESLKHLCFCFLSAATNLRNQMMECQSGRSGNLPRILGQMAQEDRYNAPGIRAAKQGHPEIKARAGNGLEPTNAVKLPPANRKLDKEFCTVDIWRNGVAADGRQCGPVAEPFTIVEHFMEKKPMRACAFSPGGKFYAAGTNTGTLRVFEMPVVKRPNPILGSAR